MADYENEEYEEVEYEEGEEGDEEQWIQDGWYKDENGQWCKDEEVPEEDEEMQPFEDTNTVAQPKLSSISQLPQPFMIPIPQPTTPLMQPPQVSGQTAVQYPSVPTEALPAAKTAEEAERTRKVLERTYAFEDYEPRRDGWLADVSTEMFVSLFFKVYFGFFLFTTGALLGFFFVNWIFTTVYRIFVPPDASGTVYIQSFGILAAFFFLSVAMVAGICLWFDVLKIFFTHTRADSDLWGLSHPNFRSCARLGCCTQCGEDDDIVKRKARQNEARERKREPSPWLFQLLLLTVVLVIPIIFSLISTIAQSKSVIYFVQQLFYVTTIVTAIVLALIYVWFHMRAYFMKSAAYGRRKEDDKEKTPLTAGKAAKDNWYRSETVLEEFGLDNRTLRWSMIALPIGMVPIFAINVAMALDGVDDSNNAGWVATVLVIFCALLLIQQVTEAKRSHRAVFVALTLLIIYVILGIVGCAVTGHPASIAVIVAPFIASQGTLIRKRDHNLSRKAQCILMNVAIEKNENAAMQATRWDTFLCSGRNTFYACLECLDIHTIFGYRHPKVIEEERRQRRERVCLRSDYKVLMGFWGIIGIFYFFVIVIGKASVERNDGVVSSVSNGVAVKGQVPFSFCDISIASAASHTKTLTVVDMAMFAAMSNSFGTDHDVDFATWFSDTPSIKRVYPTANFLTESAIDWEHVSDSTTDTHVISVRSSNRGYHWAQHIYTWGEAMAFQVASVIAPQLTTWDIYNKRSIITGMGVLKKGFASDWLPTAQLEEYVASIQSSSSSNASIILVGSGFAGGYAKIVAGRLGLAYVAFNAPGVELSWDHFGIMGYHPKSVDVVSHGSLISMIDTATKGNTQFSIPCEEDSAHACSKIIPTLRLLLTRCGDTQGRKLS